MRTSRAWVLCLAIPAALLAGSALIWPRWWKQEPSPAPRTNPVQSVTPSAERAALEPSANPDLGAKAPPAEAAALKREAVAVAKEVAEAYPNDALAYAILGSAYYNIGQSDEATRHLKRCLELNPEQADAYEILARVAYEKGDLEETARLCQEALKRGPATPDVLIRLGRAQMDSGQTDEAIRTLQRAAGLPRPTSESCYLLGQALLQSGDYARAKDGFRRAIAILPDHTQAHFGLYTACLRLGQMEEAGRSREQFQKLEAVDRQDLTDRSAREDTLTGLPMVRETVARTIFGAAQIHRLHEQAGKAADLFRRSAFLDAENPMYRAALEGFYLQRNAAADGLRAFQQLTAEQPANALNHFFLGRLQGRLEQFEAAEQSLRRVQELTPAWPEGYRALGELYLRANRKVVEARVLARKAVELEPSSPHYYLLAVACMKNQDRAGALEAAKQALVLSPDEKMYQEFLQQLQQSPQP